MLVPRGDGKLKLISDQETTWEAKLYYNYVYWLSLSVPLGTKSVTVSDYHSSPRLSL